jgi:hypothetical protein
MNKPPDMFPQPTRAEKSAQRKAAQAALHEAKLAERAERVRAAQEKAAEMRAQARARAQQAVTVVSGDVPKTQGEVRQIAKALTPRMLELLVEIAEDPMQQASGRVAAINAIIDRAHGKPVQPNVELPGAVLTDMDDEKLERYLLDKTRKFIDGKVIEHVRHNGQLQTADQSGTVEPSAQEDRQLQDRPRRPKGRGKGARTKDA